MKNRLIAVVAALVLVCAGGALYVRYGGLDSVPAEKLRALYPSYEQLSNWDFMTAQYDTLAQEGKNPKLILGSSELKSAPAGAEHPARMFADGQFGMTSVITGQAGCNDLWQAIELGAFSDRLASASSDASSGDTASNEKRTVVFTSMQWFMCYRKPSEDFPGVFSQGAYEQFLNNPDISQDLKDRVTARIKEYGVTVGSQDASLASTINKVDASASSTVNNLCLAQELKNAGVGDYAGVAHTKDGSVVQDSAMPAKEDGTPDWDSIIANAQTSAQNDSSNSYGFEDGWYKKKFVRWLTGAKKNWKVTDGQYFSEQELEDFKLMLEVCKACGIKPLVVLQPVKGEAYDQTIYTREVREQYYQMIRDICAEEGIEVADFSDHEYDTYFLRDYSHPSSLGSAYYSKAIYKYFNE